MERVLGSPINLLSGEEEARLCFLGQRAGVWVGASPVLGLDLGGGSLEAGIGTVDDVAAVASVALGTARIRGELDTGDRLSTAERAAIRELAVRRSEPIADMLGRLPGRRRAGDRQRGTVRALARLAMGLHRPPPRSGSAPRRSTRWRSPQASSTSSPTDWPRWTSTPGWRCRASRPAGRHCCPSAPWCSPPWWSTWDCAGLVVSEWGLREGAVLDSLLLPSSAALSRPAVGEGRRTHVRRRVPV